MCRQIQPVCSHCSMPQEEVWEFCDYFQLQVRYAMNENERLGEPDELSLELPDPLACWYASGPKIQVPVLFGCDEYYCPSWSYTGELGDVNGALDAQSSAAMARRIFERTKDNFAREHFVQRSIPQVKEPPVSFMKMAQQSLESTLESDSDDDDDSYKHDSGGSGHTMSMAIQKRPQRHAQNQTPKVSRVLPRRVAGGKRPTAASSSKESKLDYMSSLGGPPVVSSTPASSITPTAKMVTNKAKHSDGECENAKVRDCTDEMNLPPRQPSLAHPRRPVPPSPQDARRRPARLTNPSSPIPTTTVTKDNATVTFRLLKTPRSVKWVTSVEVGSEPRPRTAVERPEGAAVEQAGALERYFPVSRALGAARNILSRVF